MEEEPQVKVESDIVVNPKSVPVQDSDEFGVGGVQEEERAMNEDMGLLEEVETFMKAKVNGISDDEGTEDRKDEDAGPGHVEQVSTVDKSEPEPEPHAMTAGSDEVEAHDPTSEVDEGPQIVEMVNSNASLTSDKEWEDKTQEVEQLSGKEEEEVIKEAEIMEEEAPVPSETTPSDLEEQEVEPEPMPMSPEIKEPEEEEKVEPTVIVEEEEKKTVDRGPSPSSDAKSIVALNREKFERHTSTDGGPPNVTYSFKKGGVMASPAVAKEEEPKKSTVKNLRNFFQKLGSGSKDAEAGDVVTRPGLRNGGGGAQNRRTMI